MAQTLHRLIVIGIVAGLELARAASPACSTPTAADSFAGDSRLAAKRTIRVKNLPIRDFLADLNLQTGIRFFADPSVAEDRLTLISHDKPLGDLLKALARLFDFEWRRDGAGLKSGYTLIQSPSAAAAEEAARQERMNAAVTLILEEVAVYARMEKLTTDGLNQALDRAESDMKSASDPPRRRLAAVEYAVGEQVRARNDWRTLANQFLRTLTRAQVSALLKGGRNDYAWPATPGMLEFPEEFVREIKESAKMSGRVRVSLASDINFVRLVLIGDDAREPSLRWRMVMGERRGTTYSSGDYGGTLPSLSMLGAQAATEPEVIPPAIPSLARPVRVSIAGTVPDDRASPEEKRNRRATLGDALMAIDQAAPIDVVADAFYSSRLSSGYSANNVPASQALSQLAFETRHQLAVNEGFVLMRSSSYAVDRRAEPPATLLSRWIARIEGGGLDLDDYAEIAGLPDPQLTTLLQMAQRGDFPDSLSAVSQAKDHLRFWNSLNRAQRRKVNESGLQYRDLTEPQRKLLAIALADRQAAPGYGGISRVLMEASRIRIETRRGQVWGVRRKGSASSVVGVTTREDALQQLQRQDPNVKPTDLRAVVYVSLRFIYETERGLLAQAWISLPGRWENAPL